MWVSEWLLKQSLINWLFLCQRFLPNIYVYTRVLFIRYYESDFELFFITQHNICEMQWNYFNFMVSAWKCVSFSRSLADSLLFSVGTHFKTKSRGGGWQEIHVNILPQPRALLLTPFYYVKVIKRFQEVSQQTKTFLLYYGCHSHQLIGNLNKTEIT